MAPLCASRRSFLSLLLVPTLYQIHIVNYVTCLRSHMQQLRPIPVSHHASHTLHISKDLSTSTHVFIRCDAVRKLLQPPYDGPFEVTARADKFYIVLVNSQSHTISLDRLKPVHIHSPSSTAMPSSSTATPASFTALPASKSTTPQVPVGTTCSGRCVHFPERFTL